MRKDLLIALFVGIPLITVGVTLGIIFGIKGNYEGKTENSSDGLIQTTPLIPKVTYSTHPRLTTKSQNPATSLTTTTKAPVIIKTTLVPSLHFPTTTLSSLAPSNIPTSTISPTTTLIPSTTTLIPSTTTEISSTTTLIPSTTTLIPFTTTETLSTTTETSSTTTLIPSTTTEIPSTTTLNPSTTTLISSTTVLIPFTTTETLFTTTLIPSTTTLIPSTTTGYLTKDAYFIVDFRGTQSDALLQKQASITSQIIATWAISSVTNRIGFTFNSRDETKLDMDDPGVSTGQYTKEMTTLYTDPQTLKTFLCVLGAHCSPMIYPFSKFSQKAGPTISGFLSDFNNNLLSLRAKIKKRTVADFPNHEFTLIIFTQPDDQKEIDDAYSLLPQIFINYKINYLIIRINKNDRLDYSKLSSHVFDMDDRFLSTKITNIFKPL